MIGLGKYTNGENSTCFFFRVYAFMHNGVLLHLHKLKHVIYYWLLFSKIEMWNIPDKNSPCIQNIKVVKSSEQVYGIT